MTLIPPVTQPSAHYLKPSASFDSLLSLGVLPQQSPRIPQRRISGEDVRHDPLARHRSTSETGRSISDGAQANFIVKLWRK